MSTPPTGGLAVAARCGHGVIEAQGGIDHRELGVRAQVDEADRHDGYRGIRASLLSPRGAGKPVFSARLALVSARQNAQWPGRNQSVSTAVPAHS